MKALIRHRVAAGSDRFPAAMPPLLRRVLLNRSACCDDDVALDMGRMHPPGLLQGLPAAVAILEEELQRQGRILIISDFDADGATSCVLAIRALRAMGFHHVDYIVPNRFEYGYGLTPEIVDLAAARAPDLLVTVDNGISSIEGVAAANARGMRVVITDHHLPGRQLPAAAAIVNPNQPGCDFPSKSLAGVGVIFYLMIALRARLRDSGWFTSQGITPPNLAHFLDLVALGTVADVVALDRNNRILVNEGIRRIRQRQACPGLLALLQLGRRRCETLVASDLGFAVGPRLNAAGRLDDMALGIECLLTDDTRRAQDMAAQLDAMNSQRRSIEADMREQAMAALQDLHLDGGRLPAGLCLYDPQWHQGVIGILAARIKERYHRPVIAFADGGTSADGEEQIKGSARSVDGLHIRDALDTVATRHPGLLTRFGGHAMAAGLTLRKADYQRFTEAFAEVVEALLPAESLAATLLTDGEVAPADLTLETAMQLRNAGPWGQGFPEPSFDGMFRLVRQRLLTGNHLKVVLQPLTGAREIYDGIAFNVDVDTWPDENIEQVRVVYRLDVNEFRGETSLQLMIEYLEPC